jgi:energy-coupling factor transporter transmembrane protein EcfT
VSYVAFIPLFGDKVREVLTAREARVLAVKSLRRQMRSGTLDAPCP